MTEDEIERITWSWPRVIAAARNDWAKGFTKSIARQARRKSWKPSAKQAAIMRQMVQGLHLRDDGEDISLIE